MGSLSIIGLTLMLLLGLDFGGVIFPWSSPKVICLIVFGALMSLVFIYCEKKIAEYPLMPTRIFKHKSNVAVFLVDFFHGFVSIGGEYYMPLFLQSARGLSPLHSGVLLLPLLLSTALIGVVFGFLTEHTGRYRPFIWFGTVAMTLGNGLYILFKPTTSLSKIIGYQIVAGLGAGGLFQPPMIAMIALTDKNDVATAIAAFIFVRCIGSSMSLAVAGSIFQNTLQKQSFKLRAMGLPRNITDALAGNAAAANVEMIRTIADPFQKSTVKNAFAIGTRNIWILYTCVGAVSVLASLFISKSELSKHHEEVITGLNRRNKDKDNFELNDRTDASCDI
jgi:hypothetical protein